MFLVTIFLATIFELYVRIYSWYKWKWYRQFIGRIHHLPFGLILKVASIRGASEADTIRFIRTHTTIPVPHILAAAEGYGSRYMLMKRVDGHNLEPAWRRLRRLDNDQRANVIAQLRNFVIQLRALPSPHASAVCALNGAACMDSRVSSRPIGPFPDERAFNNHLIDAAEPFMDETTLPGIRARMHDDHRIVFTHGDLAPRNIIIRGDTVAAVIDWEDAGWYPEHWEFVKAMYCPMLEKDESWNRAVRDIIPQDYVKDWLVDCELSDHMVGGF